MPFETGAKIGPYQIVAPIDANGIGEVYKASDTRLNRSVSIRLLPREFSQDAEAKQRFDRDAQAVASLNHPHICALYDVGNLDGADYVVTEFLEGETLGQRLTHGPLELQEALKVAIAIADALDKAHRQGVTHRGLNPSSVMLTQSGAKLLDFGLTKIQPAGGPTGSASSLPTRTIAAPLTTASSFAAPYIAPEQWAGLEADARADIFALGAILYEMVSGKPAFEGKTPALLIAAIQSIDPEPVSKTQPMTPPALDYVLKRCLTKDPKQRLQTAWDLMSQLQWIVESGTKIGIPVQLAARRQKRDRIVWIALAAVSLLALGLAPATYRYFRGSPEAEDVRFSLPNLGAAGVNGPPASISPDGRWIVRSFGNTNRGLDSVLLSSAARQTILAGSVVTQPFWSPDSRFIAFFEDGKLKKADVSGSPSQNICEAPPVISGGTWSRDGVILFARGVLYRVLAAGGQPVAITSLDTSKQEVEHLAPSFLPDGRHYLYLSMSSQPSESAIYLGALDSKERTRLFAAESKAVYAAPGYVLFNRGDTVFAQPFDADKLALTGEAIRVADGVPILGVAATGVSPNAIRSASFAVSQTGVLTYRNGGSNASAPAANVADRSLIWFDRAGGRTGQVGGPGAYAGIDLSPDGKQVAVHVHDGAGGDSWFFDSAQGRMQRLTFDAAQDNSMPIWSPDGTRIAFGSKRNGKWGLYVKLADGTAKEELITESDAPKTPMSWSPDEKLLVYWVNDPKTRGDVWAVPLAGDRKPLPILQTQYEELHPQVSTDGKWIAYSSNETGRQEIYVKPFPEGPGKWQISTDGGSVPRWRRDGKELFFIQAPSIMAVDIHVAGSSVQPGAPRMLFGLATNPGPNLSNHSYHVYAVSADGQRFLVPQQGAAPNVSGSLADIMAAAADQGGGAAATPNGITVVLNWPRLLKQK